MSMGENPNRISSLKQHTPHCCSQYLTLIQCFCHRRHYGSKMPLMCLKSRFECVKMYSRRSKSGVRNKEENVSQNVTCKHDNDDFGGWVMWRETPVDFLH
jgi:hypothetical protein